jgi:hypothetical protein
MLVKCFLAFLFKQGRLMAKIITFILLIFTPITFSKSMANSELTFPNEKQRKEIAAKLLAGIESIDAITIALRNRTREIDWNSYKTLVSQKIISSSDWNSLYRSIDNLHYGILNRHSYLIIDKNIQSNVTSYAKWPKFELGYTWPEANFFSIRNQKSIASVNDRKIDDLFKEFFNLYCNDVHQSGCLRLFSSYMKSGYHFVGGLEQLRVKYTDGSSEVFDDKSKTKRGKKTPIDCSKLYSSLSLDLIYDGSQSCLYESADAFILKIFYFGKWGTSYDDIYCEHTKDIGMCNDINEIKRFTHGSPIKSLVIDIQNNKGGTENTPWIAALTKNGFKDNLVQYKNIPLLADPEIRSRAFYNSERAEKWYQKNVIEKVDTHGEFLPVRPDFCRGSNECDIQTIPSSSTSIKYKDLKLVINEGCVSSCDDFIWRTRQYAKAKTFGQLSATDGAYARLNGYLFINKHGHITNIITGEGNHPSGDNGALLISYQIPISKTVNEDSEPLEGNASILDSPIPINKKNFNNIELDNLVKTLSF